MTEKWKIWVCGYGTFNFEGTEQEAEERRIAKGWHEKAVSRKWRAENQRESDLLTAQIVDIWESGKGAPQKLLSALARAKTKEEAPLS